VGARPQEPRPSGVLPVLEQPKARPVPAGKPAHIAGFRVCRVDLQELPPCPTAIPTSPLPTPTTPPPGRPPVNRGVVAGSLIVGAILGCGAIGLGIGALIGAAAPLGIVGVFAGFAAGIVLVARRFSDL
jgi:hypothetical protein